MRQKHIILQIDKIEDGATLYCSEFSRLGDDYAQIINFVDMCEKRKISLIVCKENIQLDNKTPTGIIYLAIFSLLSKLELGGIRERSRAGVKAAIERGSLFGKANPNYGKNIAPELHEENLKSGNILRAKNRNINYVQSDEVSNFCKVLKSIRSEFKSNNDKSKLFYEDFGNIKIRMTGDDYVKIVADMQTHYNTKITYTQSQSMFHTIMSALRLYVKNKNELVLI
jgi:hypothetical protein